MQNLINIQIFSSVTYSYWTGI